MKVRFSSRLRSHYGVTFSLIHTSCARMLWHRGSSIWMNLRKNARGTKGHVLKNDNLDVTDRGLQSLLFNDTKTFQPEQQDKYLCFYGYRLQVHVWGEAGDGVVCTQLLLPLRQHRRRARLQRHREQGGEALQGRAGLRAGHPAPHHDALLPLAPPGAIPPSSSCLSWVTRGRARRGVSTIRYGVEPKQIPPK